MELSFWTRILLEVLVVGLTILSVFCPYLGILAAMIVVVLIANEIGTRRSEGGDFKKKIIRESSTIVDHIIESINSSRIEYSNWESKTEEFKTDILGNEYYKLFKQFYDAVENRNQYFMGKGSFGPWEPFAKFNRAIFDNFLKIYYGISWVRESIPKERITNFQSRAKHSACL